MAEPQIVSWEPRWTTPVVASDCPSCGRRADRRAASWSVRDGALHATVSCYPLRLHETVDCYRVFTVEVPESHSSEPPS